MQIGFGRIRATEARIAYNVSMSSVRDAAEWSYKDLKQYVSSQDYKRGLKLRQVPISLMYKAAALLLNFKACLNHGGQVQSYFKCKPPTLEEYIKL